MVFYFLNRAEFVNYEKSPFFAPKFTKLCTWIEWRIRANFPFGRKFKFETEFELKILEVTLLLNLDQIYWGFLKFLFALTL
jgi:hypothetical protein